MATSSDLAAKLQSILPAPDLLLHSDEKFKKAYNKIISNGDVINATVLESMWMEAYALGSIHQKLSNTREKDKLGREIDEEKIWAFDVGMRLGERTRMSSGDWREVVADVNGGEKVVKHEVGVQVTMELELDSETRLELGDEEHGTRGVWTQTELKSREEKQGKDGKDGAGMQTESETGLVLAGDISATKKTTSETNGSTTTSRFSWADESDTYLPIGSSSTTTRIRDLTTLRSPVSGSPFGSLQRRSRRYHKKRECANSYSHFSSKRKKSQNHTSWNSKQNSKSNTPKSPPPDIPYHSRPRHHPVSSRGQPPLSQLSGVLTAVGRALELLGRSF